MLDDDCCQVYWFTLSLLRATDQNDHGTKFMALAHIPLSQGLNRYPMGTNMRFTSKFLFFGIISLPDYVIEEEN